MINFNKKKTLLLLIIRPALLILNKFLFKEKIINNAKHILIIETHRIGDFIISMYLIGILKRKFPNANITYLGQKWGNDIIKFYYPNIDYISISAPWASEDGYLNFFKDIQLIRNKYKNFIFDVSIDCRGDIRNTFLTLFFCINNRIGFNSIHGNYFINTKVNISDWNNIYSNIYSLGKFFLGKYSNIDLENDKPFNLLKTKHSNHFAICIGASNNLRNIEINELNNIVCSLKGLNKFIYFFYNDVYIPYVNNLKRIYKNDKKVFFINVNLIDYINTLISFQNILTMDSASAHIAVASGSNVFIITGPSDFKRVMPPLNNIFSIKSKIIPDCSPCEKKKCNNPKHKICLVNLDYEKTFK